MSQINKMHVYLRGLNGIRNERVINFAEFSNPPLLRAYHVKLIQMNFVPPSESLDMLL
jgi:hypothetical protein